MSQNLLDILRTYFGHSSFRKGQEEVMQHILSGRSSAAVFPTGAGKSLCYQLPALCLPGLTLVVSPLLALMKDQIDSLRKKGIKAVRLDSTLSNDEYQEVMRELRSGEAKILYVAPERFMNERFRAAMSGLKISLFAVDEAHCISEWGHNFRPDYLKLPLYAKALGADVILALTATATPDVLRDIRKSFSISENCAVVTGFYRSNLTLLTELVNETNRNERLLQDLREHPRGPTIIYVTLQKTAEEVAKRLQDHSLPARAYHAGMETEARTETQNWFIDSKDGIVCATIAFGMGIDKADIRYVYHYNLPKSLENYSQEIGRAGRDGQAALCKVFVQPDDLYVLENFVYGDKASPRALRNLVRSIFEGDTWDVSLQEVSTLLDIKALVLSTLLTRLELLGFIRAETPYYQAYEFKELVPWPDVLAEVPSDRHEFLNKLMNHAEKKRIWSTLNIEEAARTLGEPRARIVAALGWLAEKSFLELRVTGLRHLYKVLRKPESLSSLSEQLYQEMDEREEKELQRIHNLLEWTMLPRCQTRALAAYFGEEDEAKVDCGHCSYCLGSRDRHIPTRGAVDEALLALSLREIADLKSAVRGKEIDAFTLTRFLTGISSPVLARSKLSSRHPSFGRLATIPFSRVLKAVEQHFTE